MREEGVFLRQAALFRRPAGKFSESGVLDDTLDGAVAQARNVFLVEPLGDLGDRQLLFPHLANRLADIWRDPAVPRTARRLWEQYEFSGSQLVRQGVEGFFGKPEAPGDLLCRGLLDHVCPERLILALPWRLRLEEKGLEVIAHGISFGTIMMVIIS